jgi:hypothetical protein
MKRISLLLLLLFLSACRPAPVVTPTATIPAASATPSVPIAPPPTALIAPTPEPDPTATSDTRLPPERWPEWPVVPAATGRAIEIYRAGLSMGLDPNAFSKVGDCQSIREAFMGYFDIPSRYDLSPYPSLLETVAHFSGHFNTDGQAVRGGFNAASALSPLWADPIACQPGENPLECELRLTKPIIVFVSLEVWWNGRTPEAYEALMRQILDIIIAHGAVPILATKADNVEGDHSLNLTTARLAHEYDLPLWNFWLAVQSLPNHGMDMGRNDGFHISTDAWTRRSFTGLQALDNVWRGLLAAVPSVSTTPASGPVATAGSLTPPNPAATAIPGLSQPVVFGVAKRQGEGYAYLGVYRLDPLSGTTSQIFGSGVQFQSASPDGKYLLVSAGSSLFRTDPSGGNPLRLTDELYPFGDRAAVWLADGQVAAVTSVPGGTAVVLFTPGTGQEERLTQAGETPIELHAASAGGLVYWESGACTAAGLCDRRGAQVTSLDGSLDQALDPLQDPLPSPDGSRLAFTYVLNSSEADLGLAAPDGASPLQVPLPGKLMTEFAWSPAGDAIGAVVAERSDYSGRVSGNRNFVFETASGSLSEYASSNLFTPRFLWSPDGSSFLWLGSLPEGNEFAIAAQRVERSTRLVTDLSSAIGLVDPAYLLVTNAAWLPNP